MAECHETLAIVVNLVMMILRKHVIMILHYEFDCECGDDYEEAQERAVAISAVIFGLLCCL